jgi:hypothetical protein
MSRRAATSREFEKRHATERALKLAREKKQKRRSQIFYVWENGYISAPSEPGSIDNWSDHVDWLLRVAGAIKTSRYGNRLRQLKGRSAEEDVALDVLVAALGGKPAVVAAELVKLAKKERLIWARWFNRNELIERLLDIAPHDSATVDQKKSPESLRPSETGEPPSKQPHALLHSNPLGLKDAAAKIAKLEREIPPLDQDSSEWVDNKCAGKLENVQTRTLAKYRSEGTRNADRTFGCDCDGRVWRRIGTPNSHPWYWRQTLESQRSKAEKKA